MTKIAYASDLHLEFNPWTGELPEGTDIVILAGDTHTKANGIRWAMERFSIPVVYVLGNHEFYTGGDLHRLPQKLKNIAAGSNVHVLNNDVVNIDGVEIIGGTLWTDYKLTPNPLNETIASMRMNDFRFETGQKNIRVDYGKPVAPSDFVAEFNKTREFILENSTEDAIIVTHHAPSPASLKDPDDPIAPAYASNFPIDYAKGKYWIHGHTHHPADYDAAGIRVLSNPKGYTDEEFQFKVLEI